jgi:hypothetical protein
MAIPTDHAYIPPAVSFAMRESYNIGIFFRLALTTPICLVLGFNDVPIKVPSIDVDGTVYRSAGLLQDLPELQTLLNGEADEVQFSLNGVAPEFADQLYEEAPPAAGADIIVGFAPYDDRYQPITDIVPMWRGVADFWQMERPVQTDFTKPAIRNITLAALGGESSRSGQSLLTFTDLYQQQISPGDRFCERPPRYYQQQIISWPRY